MEGFSWILESAFSICRVRVFIAFDIISVERDVSLGSYLVVEGEGKGEGVNKRMRCLLKFDLRQVRQLERWHAETMAPSHIKSISRIAIGTQSY
jgi:hypothetical protein